MSATRFAGKVAVVTAAGAGIGRAIALEWVRGGGTAVVADKNQAAVDETAREIYKLAPTTPAALALEVDVTQLDQIQDLMTQTARRYAGIHALFNVVGINQQKNVEEASDEEWRSVIDTNLNSVYRCAKYAIPAMRKLGGGAIVNIASTAGITAENRCAAYSASKAAIVMLTRNMAMDFAKDRIRVNALCPGATLTPRIQANMAKRDPAHEQTLMNLIPMKRRADPQEIAKAAVFLASDDASYITGTTLVVDGGLTAGIRFPFFDD